MLLPLTSARTPYFLLLVILFLISSTGCLRRRFTVRTNPPGAVVYVDNQEIGVTPVSSNYLYYGTRSIRLEKDGFEPVEQLHNFRVAWYEIPPLDFISENLIPWEIRDERELDFEMKPQRIIPPEELRTRAEQLRANATAGFTVPIPNQQQTGYPPSEVLSSPNSQLLPEGLPFQSPAIEPPAPESSGTLPPGGFVLPPPIQ